MIALPSKDHMDAKLSNTLQMIVGRLVSGDFDSLERLTNGTRLSRTEMQAAVKDYPGTLVMPPETSFEDIDVIEIEGRSPRQWSACFELWTAEEGRSDLSLELTLTDNFEDLFKVEIDNIHVR